MSQPVETPFLEGKLRLYQPDAGYRFNVDALLLAEFVLRHELGSCRFVDLGTGCGVVAVLLSRAGLGSGRAVEMQPELAECAYRSLEANGCRDVELLLQDLRRIGEELPSGCADVVVANPPYFRAGAGVLSADSQLLIARHEVACTMNDVLSAMRYLLVPGGRAYLVYPVDRLPELFCELPKHKFSCDLVQFVHPRHDRPAGNVLVRCTKVGKRPLVVEAPLVTHVGDHSYGEWFARLEGRIHT